MLRYNLLCKAYDLSVRAVTAQAPLMRDFILLYINGNRYQISRFKAFLLLSDFVREHLGLTGTKVVCGEGACGACSVLIGKFDDDSDMEFRYHAANACLLRLYQLDRCHIITVEGLRQQSDPLSPVQNALVQCHGTQCGYCTPGVVVSLTAFRQNRDTSESVPTKDRVRDALSGNLCRCTGYLPILEAGLSLPDTNDHDLSKQYPALPLWEDFQRNASSTVKIQNESAGGTIVHAHTLSDALSFLAEYPDAVLVAGGTGMLPNPDAGSDRSRSSTLSIGAIRELDRIEQRGDGLFIGATVTWARLRQAAETLFPELALLLQRFGSPQIRRQGTIGGSIAQSEANSDWLPLLLVQDATVHLSSLPHGERLLPFATFLSEMCAPGEMVTGITIPLPLPEERLRLYKVTRRQAFDRSVFCAAVSMQIAPDETITSARIACGGVGPVPQRLPQTERFLTGASYTEKAMQQAGSIAATEIKPVTDAYADAAYRRQLATRLLLRFYYDGETNTEEGGTIA